MLIILWLMAWITSCIFIVTTFIASVDSVLKLRELVNTSWLDIWTNSLIVLGVYLILLLFVWLFQRKKRMNSPEEIHINL